MAKGIRPKEKRGEDGKMSREIKFRAWNTGVKAMLHFSNPIGIADDRDRYGIFFKADEGKMYIGGSYEIMQYMRLKDKKRTEQYPEGQEIYEGDICRDDCDNIVEIVWMDNYGWGCKIIKGGVLSQGLTFPLWQWDRCRENGYRTLEIIGNRFENSDLLKEETSC